MEKTGKSQQNIITSIPQKLLTIEVDNVITSTNSHVSYLPGENKYIIVGIYLSQIV